MTKTTETRPYLEGGLSHVVLVNVEVRRCSECGNTAVVIPNVAGLHRTIARALVRKPARLLPGELRFVRKYLGLSSAAFADLLGVTDEQVLAWESEGGGKRIPKRLEFAIRILVGVRQPVTAYPVVEKVRASVESQPSRGAIAQTWRMRSSRGGGWKADSIQA